MPLTIDGVDVSDITIDGQSVQEVTIDGSVVWTATTIVDDFEDGIGGYTGDTGFYSQSSSWSINGSYSLLFDPGDTGRKKIYDTNPENSVNDTDWYRIWGRTEIATSASDFHVWAPIIRLTDADNYIFIEIDFSDPIFRAYEWENGSNSNYIDYSTNWSSINGSTFFVDFTMGNGSFEARLHDSGGSQITSISGSVGTSYGGGIGFWDRDHTGNAMYHDYWRQLD